MFFLLIHYGWKDRPAAILLAVCEPPNALDKLENNIEHKAEFSLCSVPDEMFAN